MMKHFRLTLLFVLVGVIVAACAPAAQTGMISPADYVNQYQINTPHMLLDVRNPEEYADGHIAGSINIPLEELSSQLSQVPQNIMVVVYCRSGNRSAQAVALLKDAGYTQVLDMGGIVEWVNA